MFSVNEVVMKKNYFLRFLLTLLVISTFYSCVDNDYDLGKDVDLTMGLGSENLTLKIGETEKIYLKDMLDIEDTNIDTLKDGRSLYYLIKEGASEIDVRVNKIPVFRVAEVNLVPDRVLFPSEVPGVDPDRDPLQLNNVTASAPMTVDIQSIPEEIIRLRKIYPVSKMCTMKLVVEQPEGSSYILTDVKNLTINFPYFLSSSVFQGAPGQTVYRVPDISGNTSPVIQLDPIPVEYLQFGQADLFGQLITENSLIAEDDVEMSGDFTFNVSLYELNEKNSRVNVKLIIELGAIDADRIEGIVDPLIEPVVDPIDIADELPGFLKDPAVVLEVSNPTMKFISYGASLPVPILFSGHVSSVKENSYTGPVRIPVSGYEPIPQGTDHTFYFYQGNEPFDPQGVNAMAPVHFVPTLSSLIREVPDYLQVDLSGRRVKANPDQLHSIRLGEQFRATMDYEVLVPFIFDKGLRIVYTDSILDMHDDLKDYQVSGMTLTAVSVNSIPLDLNLTLVPIGFSPSGEPETDLSGEIEVEPALVPAAKGLAEADITEANIAIVMKASNPEAVSRLDRFDIRVNGESVDSSELTSNQYFFLKEMRIKLHGQVIANFN